MKILSNFLRITFIAIRTLNIRMKYYSCKYSRAKNENKIIICMIDGRCLHGGLADRLKGITSIYMYAKTMGYDFRINFISPFSIEKIYEPNKIDWRIDSDKISYHSKDSKAYYIHDLISISQTFEENVIKKILNKKYKQIHIYSNSPLSHKYGRFSEQYHELFKLKDSFNIETKPHLQILKNDFVCVGTRFAGSLGDFNDIYAATLSSEDQIDLMKRCKVQIEKIHEIHPEKKVLIASDSDRFIEYISSLKYVYFVNGQRIHLDKLQNASFEIFKPTIIDFILISEASKIYHIQSNGMYLGAFTRSASYINNTPYEIIKF